MTNEQTLSKKLLFRVHWKKADIDVNLYERAWYGHILPRHSEDMQGKIPLVKEALEHCLEKNEIFQWARSESDEWFVQYKCPHFDPYNNFLRISIRILAGKTAIVTSAYPVKNMPSEKEIRKYESNK